MTFKWPWVSARYARFLEATVARLQHERDEQQQRADLALDQLAGARGFEPSTPAVRQEMKDAAKEVEKYLTEQFEDPNAGMLSEEIVRMAEEQGADPSKVS